MGKTAVVAVPAEDVDDFGDAFDEAVKGDSGAKPTDDSETPEEATPEEETPKEETPEEETPEEETPEEETPEEETPAAAASKAVQSPTSKDEDIDSLKHKHSTLQGMYNSEIRKRQELEEKLALLGKGDTTAATAESAKTDTATTAIDVSSMESVKKLGEEFGEELPTALSDIAKTLAQTFEEKIAQVIGMIQPISETYASTTTKQHFDALRDAHPDFENIRDSGELLDWINSQVGYKKKAYLDAYSEGDTADVIDLFTTFKDAKGYPAAAKDPETPAAPTAPPAPKVNQKELEDMEAVSGKKAPVSGGRGGGISKDNFDDAWDIA